MSMSNTVPFRLSVSIDELITAGRYAEAFRVAREEASRHPGDQRLLTTCADLYVLLNRQDQAVNVLKHVADVHAATGRPAKAVAALKKIERIGRSDPTMIVSIATRIGQRADPEATAPGVFALPDLEIESNEDVRVVEEAVIDQAVPSPLFNDFSREELVAFIAGLQLHVVDPGDIIVAQGDPGNSLFILTTGIVKAFVRVGEGRTVHVRTLHDGDFFGEISILRGGARTATITAATRCELLELDRPTLDSIVALHPQVGGIMRRFAEERLASDQSLDVRT
jgi:cAMP-dependent protein kinase regulator